MVAIVLHLFALASLVSTSFALVTPTSGPHLLSARELAEGKAHRFEYNEHTFPNGTTYHKWVPSAAVLAEQDAYYNNRTMSRPVPSNGTSAANIFQRAVTFNPPYGSDCRMIFRRTWNPRLCPGPRGPATVDCSFATEDFRIVDNYNVNSQFILFNQQPENGWLYYPIPGHRGFVGYVNAGYSAYGMNTVMGYIDGRGNPRNMKGSDWCWYYVKETTSTYWSEASCTSWCSEFNY